MRRFFVAVFGLVLRIFFAHIEIEGADKIPRQGPLMFVLNHPNALIDPGVIACLAPRPVSFMAKSTLFKMPVVGWIVRGFESIPVHRKMDAGQGADPAQNKRTFEQCRALLGRGGALAIFPEGTSHSDPALRRLKTGAARLALGAAAMQAASAEPFRIVPAGLYYTDKKTFRSSILVYYTAALEVAPVELAADFEPPIEAVRALTDRIKRALDDVTLQAEHHAALRIVERAERIFSAAGEHALSLTEAFERRRRFLAGYQQLNASHPELIAGLRDRIHRYESRVGALGLEVEHVRPESFSAGNVVTYAARSLAVITLLGPLALVGTLLHYPAYVTIRWVSRRVARGEEDMLSTIKLLAAMLFFVVTWALAALVVLALSSWPWALVALGLAPLSGWVALRVHERFDRSIEAARGLWVFMTRRREYEKLHAERVRIRQEILALQAQLPIGEVRDERAEG